MLWISQVLETVKIVDMLEINSNPKFKDKIGRSIADPAFSIHHIGYKLTFKLGNLY
jgi:hypothetical protein